MSKKATKVDVSAGVHTQAPTYSMQPEGDGSDKSGRLPHGMLLGLKRWNTPTIYNGLERITAADWTDGWTQPFNLEETRDFMPQMGPMVGYAVTVVIQPSDKSHKAKNTNAWSEYREYLMSVPGPKIVVVQDLDMTTGKKQAIGAFWGEVNSNCHRALGCIGTICDGAIRDVDEMTNAGFKALARRLCVGHAHGHPIAWGVPVTVFGTEVQPGQLIHADKHGFLCIPRSDELRVLDASLFCDQNECNTKIVATRGSIGCDFEEVCRRLAEADAAYGAANKAHFGVCPALDPLLLSPLGFGCWQLGTKADGYWGVDYTDELALEMITQAIDSGVTYFDTAEGYSDGASEAQLGRILKLLTPERRAKVVIGSKILPSNVADCRARLERSLGFLDILCIDLYMVHWPPSRDVSAEETTSTFMQLKQLQVEGKIRHIGVSNFGVSQMKLALATGVFITVNQLSFSLLFRAIEHEILPFCQANGIKTIAYSTLLQGVLAGKWADADSIPVTRTRSRHFSNARTGSRHTEAGHETLIFEALTTLKAIAAEVGVPLTTLALAYPRAKGLDCAIAGFTKTSHVEGNAASMAFVFDDALLARVDAATDAVKAAMGPNADMWDSGDAARIW